MTKGDTHVEIATTMTSGAIKSAVDAAISVVGVSGTIILTQLNNNAVVVLGIEPD